MYPAGPSPYTCPGVDKPPDTPLDPGTSQKKSTAGFERFAQLERFILEHIPDQVWNVSYKQLNDEAVKSGLTSSTEKDIRTLLYFLTVKGYTRRQDVNLNSVEIVRQSDLDSLISRFEKRVRICHFAIDWLYKQAAPVASAEAGRLAVSFSIVELLKRFNEHEASIIDGKPDAHLGDIEEALLYLSRIGALKLEGGFLVLYNAMDIRRTKDARFRYSPS